MRFCTICEQSKDIKHFHKTKYNCKTCYRIIDKERKKQAKKSKDLENEIELMLSDRIIFNILL
jgi:hypothetical protein